MSNVNVNRAIAMALAGNYKIGGDGEMMVQETLWEGIAGTVNYEITLSKMNNFDLLYILCGTSNYANEFMMSDILLAKNDDVVSTSNRIHRITVSIDSNQRYIDFSIRNNVIIIGATAGYASIFKVIGIKFTGTKSIDYSTDEQVIGKWIDGKPLYQKTVMIPITKNTGKGQQVYPHNISNIESIITFFGGFGTNGSYVAQLNSVRPEAPDAGYGVSINSTNVTVRTGMDRHTETLQATVQYTKTTD